MRRHKRRFFFLLSLFFSGPDGKPIPPRTLRRVFPLRRVADSPPLPSCDSSSSRMSRKLATFSVCLSQTPCSLAWSHQEIVYCVSFNRNNTSILPRPNDSSERRARPPRQFEYQPSSLIWLPPVFRTPPPITNCASFISEALSHLCLLLCLCRSTRTRATPL